MKFLKDRRLLSYDDICIIQGYSNLSSRSEVDLTINIPLLGESFRNPIISSPMYHLASDKMLSHLVDNDMLATVHRYFKSPLDQIDHIWEIFDSHQMDYRADKLFIAVGKCKEWIDALYSAGVRRFLVDMAHGYSKVCADTVKYIKSLSKEGDDTYIIAGNIETFEGYFHLARAGADLIRVGIGTGNICATSKYTAVGTPMISALLDIHDKREELGLTGSDWPLVIADGGIRSAADIIKAIACGADMVMCGKLLAGTSYGVGPFYDKDKNLVEIDNEPSRVAYAEYAGMASHEMRMLNNSHSTENISIEGVAGLIDYVGETPNVINNVEANMRAGVSYVGARHWKEFKDKVVIGLMSTAGIIEKDTHVLRG